MKYIIKKTEAGGTVNGKKIYGIYRRNRLVIIGKKRGTGLLLHDYDHVFYAVCLGIVNFNPARRNKYMIERLLNIGHLPVCNQNSGRAPHLFNFCFPLCWRCSSILFSMIVFSYLLKRLDIRPAMLIGMLLLIPCAADGILQYYFHIESTNVRRIMTGLLAGTGLTIIAVHTRYFLKALFFYFQLHDF